MTSPRVEGIPTSQGFLVEVTIHNVPVRVVGSPPEPLFHFDDALRALEHPDPAAARALLRPEEWIDALFPQGTKLETELAVDLSGLTRVLAERLRAQPDGPAERFRERLFGIVLPTLLAIGTPERPGHGPGPRDRLAQCRILHALPPKQAPAPHPHWTVASRAASLGIELKFRERAQVGKDAVARYRLRYGDPDAAPEVVSEAIGGVDEVQTEVYAYTTPDVDLLDAAIYTYLRHTRRIDPTPN